MLRRFSKSSTRHGLTLVEVVAGLAVLSTLLVTILIAYRKHATQVRAAQARLVAIDAADALLAEWTGSGALPPAGGEGIVPDNDKLRWRIVRSPAQVPFQLDSSVVRLEMFRPGGSKPEKVLSSVEMLVEGGGVR